MELTDILPTEEHQLNMQSDLFEYELTDNKNDKKKHISKTLEEGEIKDEHNHLISKQDNEDDTHASCSLPNGTKQIEDPQRQNYKSVTYKKTQTKKTQLPFTSADNSARVKFILLSQQTPPPNRTKVGYDVFCPHDIVVRPGHFLRLRLDLAVHIPENLHFRLTNHFIASIRGLTIVETVIGDDIKGNLTIFLKNNHYDRACCINRGFPIAQMIFYDNRVHKAIVSHTFHRRNGARFNFKHGD